MWSNSTRTQTLGLVLEIFLKQVLFLFLDRGYSYAEDYYKGGGYICPSDIFYGRPKRAVNTYGKWKVIVNLPDEYYAKGNAKGYEKYSQTQRLEQCM